jgi:cobalamin synthase
VVLLGYSSSPARKEGLGAMAVNASTKGSLLIASVITAALVALFWPWGLLNFAWVWGMALGTARFWKRKIDGITGDILGATVEIVEVGMLMVSAFTV